MTTITHQELDDMAEHYKQRLIDQGQLNEGSIPFSKYDFIAGVFAGMKFIVGERFKYDVLAGLYEETKNNL